MATHDVRTDQLPKGAGSAEGEATPRPAASTIVLRGNPMRVLLMRRNDSSTFVPGAWVFPGGVVEPADQEVADALGEHNDEGAMRVCAIRELFEETGVWVGAPLDDPAFCRAELLEERRPFKALAAESPPAVDRLVLTSRWVTPAGIPKRYDTCFYLVEVGDEATATPEGAEGVEMIWITPADALARHRHGELSMVFPTVKNLEAIASFSSVSALFDDRRYREIPVTRPVLVVDGDRKRIVLPDEP